MNTENELHEAGYMRLQQIIGDKKANPPIKGVLPVGKSHWYQGIQDGKYPAPKHIGRLSLWRARDIRKLLARIDAGELA